MPIWTFSCPTCAVTRDQWFSNYAASQNATCEQCGTALIREPVAGSFVVTGYNAKNLYSNKS